MDLEFLQSHLMTVVIGCSDDGKARLIWQGLKPGVPGEINLVVMARFNRDGTKVPPEYLSRKRFLEELPAFFESLCKEDKEMFMKTGKDQPYNTFFAVMFPRAVHEIVVTKFSLL
jgi:hypothetical protein